MSSRILYVAPTAGTTLLAYPGGAISARHIEVFTRDTSLGVDQVVFEGTQLEFGVDYAVGPSGQITLTVATDGDTDYLISRATPRSPLATQQPGSLSSAKINLVQTQMGNVNEEQDDTLADALITVDARYRGSLRVREGQMEPLPTGPRGGKFLTFDADENPIYTSSVLGADTALREDLASEAAGFLLILHKRTESGTYGRSARQLDKIGALGGPGVSLMHWIDPDLDASLLARTPTGSQHTYFQNALDNIRLNDTLTIPPMYFRLEDQVDMTRAVNLHGPGSYFLGTFNDPTKFMLNVRIEETSLEEARRLVFQNLFLEHAFGLDCRGAINLEAQTGVDVPQHRIRHEGCKYAVPNLATGYGVRIAGVDSQQHMFVGGEITNGVHMDGCADANVFEGTWFLGKKRSLIDMAPGAFKTEFLYPVCVASDGFLYIKNASQLDIWRGQFEHPSSSTGTYQATIVIRPEGYDSQSITIDRCNFGGGDVDYSVYASGAGGGKVRGLEIGVNTWGTTTVADIRLNDADVKYTKIAPIQELRGERGGETFTIYPTMSEPATPLDVNALLDVEDLGTGTAGVRLNAERLGGAAPTALLNGWACPATFYCIKDPLTDRVHFDAYVVAPGSGTDVQFMQMEEGFRPAEAQYLTVDGVRVLVLPNGAVLAFGTPTAGNIGMAGLTWVAKRSGYQPGY